jgi:hypothetical protein
MPQTKGFQLKTMANDLKQCKVQDHPKMLIK